MSLIMVVHSSLTAASNFCINSLEYADTVVTPNRSGASFRTTCLVMNGLSIELITFKASDLFSCYTVVSLSGLVKQEVLTMPFL